MSTQNVTEWRGQELLDNDGEKIGTIEEIYLDTDTDRPE
jgi:sporulation protein YlmC with PRC-barrel domain